MKKILIILVLSLIVSFAFASDLSEKIRVEVKTINQTETSLIAIDFDSFEEFEAFDFEQLSSIDKTEGLKCDVTVTVSVGVGSTHVSATVTARDVDCSKLAGVLKDLRDAALEALK